MATSGPSLSKLGQVESRGVQFFADLCHPTAIEQNQFYAACALSGLALAVVVYLARRRIEGSGDIHFGISGCLVTCFTIVAVSVVSGWAVSILFPDPRDNGNDCGFTPDSLFLPIEAGVIVPVAFVIGYALMLMFFSREQHSP